MQTSVPTGIMWVNFLNTYPFTPLSFFRRSEAYRFFTWSGLASLYAFTSRCTRSAASNAVSPVLLNSTVPSQKCSPRIVSPPSYRNALSLTSGGSVSPSLHFATFSLWPLTVSSRFNEYPRQPGPSKWRTSVPSFRALLYSASLMA